VQAKEFFMLKACTTVILLLLAATLLLSAQERKAGQNDSSKGPKTAPKDDHQQRDDDDRDIEYCPLYLVYSMYDPNSMTTYYYYGCHTCAAGCLPAEVAATEPHTCNGDCNGGSGSGCGGSGCQSPITKRHKGFTEWKRSKREKSANDPVFIDLIDKLPTNYAEGWQFIPANGLFKVTAETALVALDADGKTKHQFHVVEIDVGDPQRPPIRIGLQMNDAPAGATVTATGRPGASATDQKRHIVTDNAQSRDFHVWSAEPITWQ
jgi:hypothetical protein